MLGALPLLTLRRRPLGSASAVLVIALALNLSVPVASHFGAALAVALFGIARSQRAAVTAVAAVAACALSLVGRVAPFPPSVGSLIGSLSLPRWWWARPWRSGGTSRRWRCGAGSWRSARWPTSAAGSPASCTTSSPIT
ncbi:hypothetical protein [Streptomyces tateyamensis]|uniref:hypothetical protein n=1 Tax=Streptomyces tateyamensis TaxID=565073 RepID=UPI0015E8B941|nr:hypothetical protein [Streptomyces tateyamensis]